MVKVAITGASGLLGKYLVKTQPKENFDGVGESNKYEVYSFYRNHKIDGVKMDVSNISEVLDRLWSIDPDVIIHCAANGDVDDVESNSSNSVRSDLLGTINLKDYADKIKCKLVVVSTNAVFDGENPPYLEHSSKAPVNIYGKIKSLAEDIVVKGNDWMIIRPMLMYGWNYEHGRGNWATKIVDKLSKGEELRLVTDSYSQPSYAGDVAQGIWDLVMGGEWNTIYNVASEREVSIYDFGKKVAQVFGLDASLIKKAKLSEFKTIATRPINTCFNTDKIQSYGIEISDIETGLKKMKDET